MAGLAPPEFLRTILCKRANPKVLTLVIVRQHQRLLLGLKKRGFGAGFYNGFGGKVEQGETIEQAALRELHEEAGIVGEDLQKRGILTFVFDDQPIPWQVHVFLVTQYKGEPAESDEMVPTWFNLEELPYDKMWADDRFWYPLFLDNQPFTGVFAFQDTTSLQWHALQQVATDAELDMEALLMVGKFI